MLEFSTNGVNYTVSLQQNTVTQIRSSKHRHNVSNIKLPSAVATHD